MATVTIQHEHMIALEDAKAERDKLLVENSLMRSALKHVEQITRNNSVEHDGMIVECLTCEEVNANCFEALKTPQSQTPTTSSGSEDQ